jgi:hypothetical protein
LAAVNPLLEGIPTKSIEKRAHFAKENPSATKLHSGTGSLKKLSNLNVVVNKRLTVSGSQNGAAQHGRTNSFMFYDEH